MKVKDFLTSKNWCKGELAFDKEGYPCEPTDPKAVEWCIIGAIHKCYPTMRGRDKMCRKLAKIIGVTSIPTFNDDSSWKDVKAAIMKADV